MQASGPDRQTLIAFGVVVVIGGSNFVAVRFSNAELAPFWGATLRFTVATALFFAIVAWRRIPLPRPDLWPAIALIGALGFAGSYALLYWALLTVHAATAAVLLALTPLLTLFLAAAHGVERLRTIGVVGALISAAGIAVIYRDQVEIASSPVAIAALVLAAACVAENGVLVRRLPRADPFATNAVALLVGVVILAALALVVGEPRALPSRTDTWLALAYLAIVGSVPLFALNLFVVRRWSASGASYFFVLAPLVTVMLGAAVAGEAVSLAFVAGAAMVSAGVYVGALRR